MRNEMENYQPSSPHSFQPINSTHSPTPSFTSSKIKSTKIKSTKIKPTNLENRFVNNEDKVTDTDSIQEPIPMVEEINK